jgi:hypothetical protein
MKGCSRMEVQLQLFLTLTLLADEWSFLTLANLPPRYQLNRRVGGPQSRSGHFGEYKNVLFLSGIEPQIIQLTVWSLYQLSYHSCWTVQLTVWTADSIVVWTRTGSSVWVCIAVCWLAAPSAYVLCGCLQSLHTTVVTKLQGGWWPLPVACFRFIIQQSAYSWCCTAVCWLLTVQLNRPSSPLPQFWLAKFLPTVMYNQHIFFHHITSTSTVHSSEVEHTKHNTGPENLWHVNVLCGFICLVPPLKAQFVVNTCALWCACQQCLVCAEIDSYWHQLWKWKDANNSS